MFTKEIGTQTYQSITIPQLANLASSLDIEGSTKRSLTKYTSETFFRKFLATPINPQLVVYNSSIIKANESKSKHGKRKSVY